MHACVLDWMMIHLLTFACSLRWLPAVCFQQPCASAFVTARRMSFLELVFTIHIQCYMFVCNACFREFIFSR